MIYTVQKFDFNPKRCFHCSLYGNSSDSFNRKSFCDFCGANHYLSECPIKKEKGNPKCRHCKGQHVSYFNKCTFFQHAKEIENNAKSGKLSLEDTRKQYNALNTKYLASFNLNDNDGNVKSISRKADKQSRPKQNKNLLEYDSDESSIPINNFFSLYL